MRVWKVQVALVIWLTMVISASVLANTFVEDFSAMPAGTCYPDGSTIGVWQFVYNGYGCNGFVTSNSSNTMLFEQPATSTSPTETHATLVIGPYISGDFTLQVSAATAGQLRVNAPNPWEVAWVLWHYTDNSHFYYFVAKPNGWELGKEDPAYPGAQRFLTSGASPSFPIGQWYRIGIAQSGQTIQVSVNDVLITTFTDRERTYSSGRVGLYSEDAEAYFDNVSVVTGARAKKGRP